MKTNNTTRHLVRVEIVKISSEYIYDLRSDKKNKDSIFTLLPQYTINKNDGANNCPIPADAYLQFVGFSKDDFVGQEYLLFDLDVLDEELRSLVDGNIGDIIEIENIDFEKILKPFNYNTEEDLKKINFPKSNYIIVEIEHLSSHDYYDGYDYNYNFSIIGYLDEQMMFKSYE